MLACSGDWNVWVCWVSSLAGISSPTAPDRVSKDRGVTIMRRPGEHNKTIRQVKVRQSAWDADTGRPRQTVGLATGGVVRHRSAAGRNAPICLTHQGLTGPPRGPDVLDTPGPTVPVADTDRSAVARAGHAVARTAGRASLSLCSPRAGGARIEPWRHRLRADRRIVYHSGGVPVAQQDRAQDS